MKRFLSSLLLFLLIPTLCFGGVNCDGVDDYIYCGNINSPTTQLTLVVWTNHISSERGGYISKGYGSGSPYISYGIWDQDGNTPKFVVGVTGFNEISSSYNLDNGSDYVLIGRYSSGVAQNIRIYDSSGTLVVDVDAETAPTGSIQMSSEQVVFCRERASSDNYSNIRVFDSAIWDSYLTDNECDILAKSKSKRLPLQIQPSNLLAYWTFNDEPDGTSADGDTFLDLSGNGNTCTGSDGANNTGLTAVAETVLTYP